jgi:rubrerythrin
MNIFDCAIKMENEARTYYERLAAASKVAELKNLFSILADAEQEHLDALVSMKSNPQLQRAGFSALDGSACAFKPLLTKRELIAELENDPDSYRHVITEEENEIRFYEDLAARAEDEATRKALLSLADEERKHLEIVENIYSFVEEPKTYLAWGEFSNLKEY